GDANNNTTNDQGGIAEQTVVSPATPALASIASPNVTLPDGPPGTVTLSDSAFLFFGFNPTGSIAFTLTGPGGFSFSPTDTVSGNGPYTASTTLANTGTVAGPYTRPAHDGGDANNNAAVDQGGITEQTTVRPANPTLVTLASSPPPLRRGTGPATLTDTAGPSGRRLPPPNTPPPPPGTPPPHPPPGADPDSPPLHRHLPCPPTTAPVDTGGTPTSPPVPPPTPPPAPPPCTPPPPGGVPGSAPPPPSAGVAAATCPRGAPPVPVRVPGPVPRRRG